MIGLGICDGGSDVACHTVERVGHTVRVNEKNQ